MRSLRRYFNWLILCEIISLLVCLVYNTPLKRFQFLCARFLFRVLYFHELCIQLIVFTITLCWHRRRYGDAFFISVVYVNQYIFCSKLISEGTSLYPIVYWLVLPLTLSTNSKYEVLFQINWFYVRQFSLFVCLVYQTLFLYSLLVDTPADSKYYRLILCETLCRRFWFGVL